MSNPNTIATPDLASDTYTRVEQQLSQSVAQGLVLKSAPEQELHLLLSTQAAPHLLEKTGLFKKNLQSKDRTRLEEESELEYLASEWQQQAILEQQEQEALAVNYSYENFMSEEEEQDEDFAEDLEEDLERRQEEDLEEARELEEAWQAKRLEEQKAKEPQIEVPYVDPKEVLKPVLDPAAKKLTKHVIKPLARECEEILADPAAAVNRAFK